MSIGDYNEANAFFLFAGKWDSLSKSEISGRLKAVHETHWSWVQEGSKYF